MIENEIPDNSEVEITSVCDECSRPLAIYGFNQRLLCDENNKLIYNEFCDEHAEEFGVELVQYFIKKTIKPKRNGVKPHAKNIEFGIIMKKLTSDILKSLSLGLTEKAILKRYPYLSRHDLLACYAFAAQRI